MDVDEAKNIICGRVAAKLRPLCDLPVFSAKMGVWVAGGAVLGHREGDVDLFCAAGFNAIREQIKTSAGVSVVSDTANATTVKLDDFTFQFCNYNKPTLADLLKSFDYAHCQIGCEAVFENGGVVVSGVEWTDAYALSRAVGTTWFVGSEYPLSSLIRSAKYRQSGLMSSGAHVVAIIDTLVATIRRGFKDYDDFKAQLDAIDLGLVPDDLAKVERAALTDLFQLLRKDTIHDRN